MSSGGSPEAKQRRKRRLSIAAVIAGPLGCVAALFMALLLPFVVLANADCCGSRPVEIWFWAGLLIGIAGIALTVMGILGLSGSRRQMAPGWYPDQAGNAHWWDGEGWTS